MKISQISTYRACQLQMQLHLQRNSSSVGMLFCHQQLHYIHQAPARDWKLCQTTFNLKQTEYCHKQWSLLPSQHQKEKSIGQLKSGSMGSATGSTEPHKPIPIK